MPSPTSLKRRNRQPEIMDQSGLDGKEHRQALDALVRINRWSRTDRAIWPHVRDFCRSRREAGIPGPVRLLDVATGGGDLPILLGRRAKREGLNLEVSGCDRSKLAVVYARNQARRRRAEVKFFEHDAIGRPIPEGYHIALSSLFLHHLGDDEAVAFLRALATASELVLVDDLQRSLAGWLLAYAGVRVLSRSRIAHVDGPLSVEGAFTCDEARELARQAGWERFEVRSRWPCRFLMIGTRS